MSSNLMIRNTALSDQLHTVLGEKIQTAEYPRGSRLPAESQLAEEFGVSRTVVREAIARLRSDGLVTTRPGLGAFVSDSLNAAPFRLPLAEAGQQLAAVRELLEMRLGLESEAAAFAAERGTDEQIAAIGAALDAAVRAHREGRDGVEEDFQFHRAIAQSTNNSVFQRFLVYLEQHLRDQLEVTRRNSAYAGLLVHIEGEHQRIYEAIKRRDSDGARDASRSHLRAGIERLKAISGV